MCDDLYTVRMDGSGAARLTHKGPDERAENGAFSRDGRYVAFFDGGIGYANPAVAVLDQRNDTTTRVLTCDDSNGGSDLAWSPFDDRLAIYCGTTLTMVAVDGSSGAPVTVPYAFEIPTRDDAPVGVGWLDPLRVLLVTAGSGATSNGPIHLTTLTLGSRTSATVGTWSTTIESDPWLADLGMLTGPVVAPDGHAAAIYADPTRNLDFGDDPALYSIDPATGVAQRAAAWPATEVGWTADSRSLVFVDRSGDAPFLTIYDLAGKHARTYGVMPVEYQGGIWRGS